MDDNSILHLCDAFRIVNRVGFHQELGCTQGAFDDVMSSRWKPSAQRCEYNLESYSWKDKMTDSQREDLYNGCHYYVTEDWCLPPSSGKHFFKLRFI